MRPVLLAALASAAEAARYVMYFDQWHRAKLPDQSKLGSVTHLITAFAPSDTFLYGSDYEPFMPLASIRALLSPTAKVCMAIGGWSDTEGFSDGSRTEESRKTYAKNVADNAERLGYDCVDVDWEYPGGNGENYKKITNDKKTFEIETYPLLLAEIKKAIGTKELSIAVPGLKRDLIAFTKDTVPKIEKTVDFVNVMTYDLMNRRDNLTTHHTSLGGSREIIKLYVDYGFSAAKINLGFAFYAKWYTTAPGVVCDKPRGCPTVVLEGPDGTDLGRSGATTFEAANWEKVPEDLIVSPDGSCGSGTGFMCDSTNCCGQYGYCGEGEEYCNFGCQHGYGRCVGGSTLDSFHKALLNGAYQASFGAQWYWDPESSLYWSWDTPQVIDRKINEVAKGLGLGGIMAWSLAQDSYKWEHLDAMTAGYKKYLSS